MKKVSLFVLFVLLTLGCMSVVCCADEEYAALHEQLDAADYSGVIAELSALSPEFAKEQAKRDADLMLFEKYRSLIDALERRDYAAAQTDMDRLIREASFEYEAIEITGENWSEYFYISIEDRYDVDYFGNPEYYRLDSRINLKEEYLVRLAEDMENDVRFNFYFVNEPALIRADFVNKSFEVLTKISSPVPQTCEVKAFFRVNADNERSFSGSFTQSGYSETDRNGNVSYLRDFFLEYEVLDAVGTIWLYKE